MSAYDGHKANINTNLGLSSKCNIDLDMIPNVSIVLWLVTCVCI